MNNDLISREAAIAQVERRMKLMVGDQRVSPESVINFLKNRPAVDAVEVVRCKDCMHSALLKDTDFRNNPPWRYYREDCRVCRCNALIEDEPIVVEENCYCAYGAKMDLGGITDAR
jgi:hypothetical protein